MFDPANKRLGTGELHYYGGLTEGALPGIGIAVSWLVPAPVPLAPNCGDLGVPTTTPTLRWTDVLNEVGYVVTLYAGNACMGTPLHTSSTLPANTASYVVPAGAGLQNGQTYCWEVVAKGDGTNFFDSPPSNCCGFGVSTNVTGHVMPYPVSNPFGAAHYWRLNNNSNDEFGVVFGEVTGAYSFHTPFFSGASMSGDGTASQYFDSQVAMWSPSNNFTVTFWLKTTGIGAGRLWGSIYNSGTSSHGMSVGFETATRLWWTLGGTDSARTQVAFDAPLPVTDGQWHQWTFVHTAGIKASNLTVYLNGLALPATTNQDSATVYNAPGGTTIFLGLRAAGGVLAGVPGCIDDILIFQDVALSAGQVQTLFTGQYPVDEDSDGLLDWWEWQFFGHLGQASGDDPDGDGMNNGQEWGAGTNPTDAGDVFRITESGRAANGRFKLTFSSKSGKTYQPRSATDLAAGDWADCPYATSETGDWQSAPIAGTGNAVTIYVEPTGTARFWRVRIQP